MIETEREENLIGIVGEETAALLQKNELKIEREEDLIETGEEGSVALLLNLIVNTIEMEREENLIEIEEEGSAVLLQNLMENAMIDMVKEEGDGAPLSVDHQTGTGGGAGE